jgi:Putative auto-transporter adhesin, head GIN domain
MSTARAPAHHGRAPRRLPVALAAIAALLLAADSNLLRRVTTRVIRATGRATRLDVTISGSGTALLSQLVAHDVKAGVSGDGSIVLTATHGLDARVSGSGTIVYGGYPAQIATRVTGKGTITPG